MDIRNGNDAQAKPPETEIPRLRQEVWSWGAGTDGQLGSGKLEDENSPHPVSYFNPSHQVTMLAGGGGHVIALTLNGKVMSWGRGTSGELGHGNKLNMLFPEAVTSLDNHFIVHVSAGWNHSGFVSDSGRCFVCGNGSFGQLGLENLISQVTPVSISYFKERHVKEIACGLRHSLVLLQDSTETRVYSFGSGRHGQLGLGEENVNSTATPCRVYGLDNTDVATVSANGDHSAALCSDGQVYTWGRGFTGSSNKSPKLLVAPFRFQKITLGWNHSLLLTIDGELCILGFHRGVLKSLYPKVSGGEEILQSVGCLRGIKVTQIAAGAEHSVVVTESGEMRTWGWGEHGQLGLGQTDDQEGPQPLSLPSLTCGEEASVLVFCGSGFSYAIRSISVANPP